MTSFRGFHSPSKGLSGVLRNALTKVIQPSKHELRIGITLLRTLAKPELRLRIVSSHTVTGRIISPNLVLRISISCIRLGEQGRVDAFVLGRRHRCRLSPRHGKAQQKRQGCPQMKESRSHAFYLTPAAQSL